MIDKKELTQVINEALAETKMFLVDLKVSSDNVIDVQLDSMESITRERNSERPPRNSHGDWPFLRPPERVPEGPVVSREHLPQLEKIQEVLPSRRDEAHFR